MTLIKLSNGMYSEVDDDLYDLLSKHKWRLMKRGSCFYARTGQGKNEVSMHRIIMEAKKGQEVDHIDGNGLNNQKYNLRFCTHRQNIRNSKTYKNNTSGYVGVSKVNTRRVNRKKPWGAKIMTDNGRRFLGYFSTEREAGLAYQRAAMKLFGEFFRERWVS